MMMGEGVEDAGVNQQQHPQVANTVVVDDEAESEQEEIEYEQCLASLSLKTSPDTSDTNNTDSSSYSALFKLLNVSPKHLARRRVLLKRQNNLLKKTSTKRCQVLANREFHLKFLDALYIRNAVFQLLPHSSSVISSIKRSSHNNSTSDAESKSTSVSNTNHRLHEPSDELSDDKDGLDIAVPKPSSITSYRPKSGEWYNFLKSKAMNKDKPEHLLDTAYDNNHGQAEARKTVAPKQRKKRKSHIVAVTEQDEPKSISSDKVSSADEPKPPPPVTCNSNAPKKSLLEIPTPPSIAKDTNSEPKMQQKPKTRNFSLAKMRSLGSLEPEAKSKPTLEEPANSNPSSSTSNIVVAVSDESPKKAVSATFNVASLDEPANSKNSISYLCESLSKTIGLDVSKPEPVVSSIASELSVKSVISENTDSSSSSGTNGSSCSSLNDNISIVPASASDNAVPGPSTKCNTNTSDMNASTSSSCNHGSVSVKSNKKLSLGGPKAPKKYSEKMKAEASVLQRISELQKEGMWWEKRLPKIYEPQKPKSHWDYLLEEMTWMAADFANERKWKRNAARKCARMIERYYQDKQLKRQKAEKEEEIRKRKTASTIAKLVRQFWSNVQTVVEFKEQTIIDSMRKKALDQKLSYLVNETEKYSEIVAQTFTAIAIKTGIDGGNDESKASDISSLTSDLSKPNSIVIKEECPSPPPTVEEDDEFVPPPDSESDVDDTIAEQEKTETVDHKTEIDDLEAENNMSYEELLAKYSKYIHNPEAYKEPVVVKQEPKTPERRLTRGRPPSGRQLRYSKRTRASKIPESDIETDVDDHDEIASSSTEEESHDEDATEESNCADLASLLKSISSSEADHKTTKEEETNKLANLAESLKPKGYTLSSTTVVTKIPSILRGELREYQHIGLDWLVTMYDKRLNGILADEMGLGKTIQTIALLAYLAVDRRNWGPHLIIVPTSVMLNWEMEFKKWCPGFKILTYYGSQKERKLKRSGWTKPNAFHVCITSYKLVIQDHQSFRRKRWKYLILDEAQNIKNFKSQRWQLLLNFHSQRRLLLTGTPLQNNLMELWSLLHFLMPNVFQSHMEFKDWFSNPMSGMVEGSQEYNEDIVRRLHQVIRPFILRRMKSEVEKQLPQKFEHVVMCSLSKRQRYLYEEFMSRTKTKNTLNQGNLLSVINVLMQLRKVCNHPNLFEPRPISSPFQTDGVDFKLPSCLWDMMPEYQENQFWQYYPLFTITNPRLNYDKYEAQRIEELTPLFAYNPDEERRYVVMNYAQCGDAAAPPAKRPRRIINLVNNEPPPCPRLQTPLTFFMTNHRPEYILKDRDFMDYLGQEANASRKASKAAREAKEAKEAKEAEEKEAREAKEAKEKEELAKKANYLKSQMNASQENSPEKPVVVTVSDSDHEEGSSGESDVEILTIRKRKIAVPEFDMVARLDSMGLSLSDFHLDYIEERKLQDRKLVVNNLNKINWIRCRVHEFVGPRYLNSCRIVGALPPVRLTSRKGCCRLLPLPKEQDRDYANKSYFNIGFGEITKIIRMRELNVNFMNHPLMMWTMSKHLDSLIHTPESILSDLKQILIRYVMYIPAVSAPSLSSDAFRPSCSSLYFTHLNMRDEYKKQLTKPTDIVHPIISRMLTQFPDPRLIQYDCGKLQTLYKLLRRLKTESHRVLIFTQMAKVLDILEAFLNYNGHTYLRLDGATKIDQRQLLMERFNADKKIFCFILSTRSGGIGVNLTGADTVIFYDSDWNPTMDAQAQDRCHRIGQTRDVHIYRLVSEKTVEENILKKSNQKRMLGELAIEGGKFTTTYFKQNTIRDLFTINEKDDVSKRLSTWNLDPSSGKQGNGDEEEGEGMPSYNPSELMKSPEKRHEMHMIECALAAAEDDTDVQAAQTVHAEAEAEMAEFDENVSLDALDEMKMGPNRFEIEFQQVFERMTDVERYALRLMESTIDDWSKETVAQAQRDLEEQKLAWELQQQKTLQETKIEVDEEDACSPEDMLTYSRAEANAQVWVAQFGNYEQEAHFMVYEPPTPPRDDTDVYFDYAHGYLYDYGLMSEHQLPPVYVPKPPKKVPSPASPVAKQAGEKTPEPPKEPVPEVVDLDSDATSPNKKSPKVARREDPIFAPKSLFDRPSPAMAKLRRDLRLQRYSINKTALVSSKTTLGPGSITFPIVAPGAQKTPPPPAPADSFDWLIAEDHCLLTAIRNVLELPPNLLIVNLAQIPNWDFGAEVVHMTGYTYRTQKMCKWRYENVIAPREEGKLMFDPPSTADPASPSAGKKKKAKTFIKITPPSPSKTIRNVKISQLLSQDNNQQFKNIICGKLDAIRALVNKRVPAIKASTVTSNIKSNKHAQVLLDHGITFDSPLQATQIAQTRYDRIQMERKKMEIARQQAAIQGASVSGTVTVAGVPATIISTGSPTAVATAATNANNSGKPRAGFTSVTIPGNMGHVLIQNNSAEIGTRSETHMPAIITQQRRSNEMTQQFALKQGQQTLVQSLSTPPSPSPPVVSQTQQQQQTLILSSGPGGPNTPPQIVRPPTPVQVHPPPPPPVVISSGMGQPMASAPITVSSSAPTTVPPPPIVPSQSIPVGRHVPPPAIVTQTPIQRTITMQDLVSSANSQRLQAGLINTSNAGPTIQTGPQQQSQPTLVSLTPMIGANSPQLTTKLIQNPQGIATLVQSTSRPGSPSINQQAGNKLSPMQLQYLRQSGIIRQSSQVNTTTQQQQVLAIKEQLVNSSQQIKRIQVVAGSGPPTIVSSSNVVTSQPTPSISSLSSPNTYGSVNLSPATSSTVVTINTSSSTAKTSLPQSAVTLSFSQPGISTTTTASALAQQNQRQVQLVKQHTVGGKTVTRPVTDAEVAAFLKHHGIPAITNPVNAQGQLAGSKAPVGAFQSVQGGQAVLAMGLQNIMKVQASASGSLANLAKSPTTVQTSQPSGGLYPVHVSKMNTKNSSGGNSKQQNVLGVQQVMIQRRQPDPPQPSQQAQGPLQQLSASNQASTSVGGKMTPHTQIITTQVTPQGNIPTHVVVQTTQKPNTLGVQQIQQVIKQVQGTNPIMQPQMMTKSMPVGGNPNALTVTTCAAGTPLMPHQSPGSAPPTLVQLPSMPTMVQNTSRLHTRIVPIGLGPMNSSIGNQTIQVLSRPPTSSPMIQSGPPVGMRPPVQVTSAGVHNMNSIHIKIPPTSKPMDDNT